MVSPLPWLKPTKQAPEWAEGEEKQKVRHRRKYREREIE
jgi:hypothetical protein